VLHAFRVVEGGADLEWVAELPTEPHTTEWLELHPTNGRLYALAAPDRTAQLLVGPTGVPLSVETFTVGGGGAHMDLSRDGRWAVISCYAAGEVEILPIRADASLGPPVDSKVVANRLLSYDPALADRQESAHPHQARFDPFTNRWCLVCDLGSDVVWVYGFDTASGTLSGASTDRRHLRLPQGAGPRHLDFHPSGKCSPGR
jgi:6-phosphogluconolactonase (cycloisomerase 2 family)